MKKSVQYDLETGFLDFILENNYLYNWIEASALDGFWYWNLNNCHSAWISEKLRSKLECSKSDISNDIYWWKEFVDKEDLVTVSNNIIEHLEKGVELNDQIIRYRSNYGQRLWFLCRYHSIKTKNNSDPFFIVSYIDITSFMAVKDAFDETARQLKESNAIRDFAINASNIGIWEWDIPENRLTWSKEMYSLYQVPKTVFRGIYDDWRNVVHPEDLEMAEKAIILALDGKSYFDITFRIIHPNGEIRYIKGKAQTTLDKDGKPIRLLGANWDVTEEKFRETELKKAIQEQADLINKLNETQKQLLHAEKLASVGQLAAGIAHEINNPVGYINTNLNTLTKYIDDISIVFKFIKNKISQENSVFSDNEINEIKRIDLEFLEEDIKDLVSESLEGVSRVTAIVQDLKDFSHVNESDWGWSNIHKGIESTLNVAHNELKYKVKVIKNFGDIPDIECVIAQLNQVFMNLFINASHAIEEQGDLTISTGMVDNDRIWLTIEDTGCGIPENIINKVFDPFFTTKAVGKGTGLGLSLSYGIIMKHKGKLIVDSQQGKGTTFRIELPVKQIEDNSSNE